MAIAAEDLCLERVLRLEEGFALEEGRALGCLLRPSLLDFAPLVSSPGEERNKNPSSPELGPQNNLSRFPD